jgi:predicted amidohydrolase
VGIRVACAQGNLPVGDGDACMDKTCSAIAVARAQGAMLLVLPELANCGYALESAEEARACGEQGAACIQRWQDAAGALITVVAGFCELSGDRVYNSCIVIDASGVRATYRKLHLWDRETLLFTPGNAPPPVIRTSFGTIAAAICYDLEFPELTRRLALSGADLLTLPTAIPRNPRPEGTHPMAVTIAMATARLNGMFVASCDHCDAERGLEFDGSTVIVSHLGWPLAGPPAGYNEGLVIADCDLEAARDKKRGLRNDLFVDRRPAMYS